MEIIYHQIPVFPCKHHFAKFGKWAFAPQGGPSGSDWLNDAAETDHISRPTNMAVRIFQTIKFHFTYKICQQVTAVNKSSSRFSLFSSPYGNWREKRSSQSAKETVASLGHSATVAHFWTWCILVSVHAFSDGKRRSVHQRWIQPSKSELSTEPWGIQNSY